MPRKIEDTARPAPMPWCQGPPRIRSGPHPRWGCSGTEGLSSASQTHHCPRERAEGRTCATATCVCCCCCCRSCWRSCIWWWAERGVPRSGSWADEGSSILGDAVRISSGWRQPCKTPASKVGSHAPRHGESPSTHGLRHRATPKNTKERSCGIQSKCTLCWGCQKTSRTALLQF